MLLDVGRHVNWLGVPQVLETWLLTPPEERQNCLQIRHRRVLVADVGSEDFQEPPARLPSHAIGFGMFYWYNITAFMLYQSQRWTQRIFSVFRRNYRPEAMICPRGRPTDHGSAFAGLPAAARASFTRRRDTILLPDIRLFFLTHGVCRISQDDAV